MVSSGNTVVKRLSKINLIAFYIAASVSLFLGLVGEYQKSLFDLIVALLNLYMYFDLSELEKDGI